MSFSLQAHPIQISSYREGLNSNDLGGFVFFEGRVRGQHEGRKVIQLQYEAYKELAIKEGERIVREISRRHGVRAAAVHAIGNLLPGDLAVWVGVAGVHREEAFLGCREIIDAIKASVPIWKREIYAEGEGRWVEGCACGVQSGKDLVAQA